MQRNESKALALLNELNQIFSYKVKKFDGKIIKSLDDGYLVEFNSAKMLYSVRLKFKMN